MPKVPPQLELFPKGTSEKIIIVETVGPSWAHNRPAYNVTRYKRWLCTRCQRGGMRSTYGPSEKDLEYARTQHKCPPTLATGDLP